MSAYGIRVYGYKITIGGRWGKRFNIGKPLGRIVESSEEALNIIEKIILLFKEQGIDGERLSDTIDRLGFENIEAQIFDDGILKRKNEIAG